MCVCKREKETKRGKWRYVIVLETTTQVIRNELEKEKEGQMEIVGYVGGGEKTKRERERGKKKRGKHMDERKEKNKK